MAKTHRTTPVRGEREAQWRGQTRGSKRISLAEEGADDKERELQGWPAEDDEEDNTVAKKGKKKKKKAVEKEVVAKEKKVEATPEEKKEKEGVMIEKGVNVKKAGQKEVYDASVWDWGDDKW